MEDQVFDREKLYAPSTVCDRLELARSSFRELAAREGIRPVRLGDRIVRYRGAELVALLERAAVRPPAPRGGVVRSSPPPGRAA